MKKVQIRRDSYEVSLLMKKTEEKFGMKMHTPMNFDELSSKILSETKEYISSTTLKRLWGYIDAVNIVRYSTLNILSKYIGMNNWDGFSEYVKNNGNGTSCECYNADIEAKNLSVGDRITLSWWPDRTVVFEYKGDLHWEVVSSENSKLSEGDTFKCAFIVNGEPLILDCYVHNGMTPTKYICGKEGGVKVLGKE